MMANLIVPKIEQEYSEEKRKLRENSKITFQNSVRELLDKVLNSDWRKYIFFCWTETRFTLDSKEFGSKNKFKSVSMQKEFNLSTTEIENMNSFINLQIEHETKVIDDREYHKNLVLKFKPIFDKFNNERVFMFINEKNLIQINIGDYKTLENYYKMGEFKCKLEISQNLKTVTEPEFMLIPIKTISLAKEFISRYEDLHDEIIEISVKLRKEIKTLK